MKKLFEYFRIRVILFKLSIVYSFKEETAYLFNNWGNILSGTFYMLSILLFIDVLYSNTSLIAGYTKDQMLFFTLVNQVGFYLFVSFIWKNIRELIMLVNSGSLDLILTKPVPSLFYVSTKTVSIFSVLRDYLPSVLIILLAIDFSKIEFEAVNLIIGVIVFIFGFIAANAVHFISVLPVFILGESNSFLDLTFSMDYDFVRNIPFEGWNFSRALQIFFTFVLPFVVSGGLATSVIIGKTDPLIAMGMSLIVAIFFSILKAFLWQKSLKIYSSASS